MNTSEFEAQRRAEGYTEFALVTQPGDYYRADHSHPFDAYALITEGEITLGVDQTFTRYPAGSTFSLSANRTHDERAGGAGVSYFAARRFKA